MPNLSFSIFWAIFATASLYDGRDQGSALTSLGSKETGVHGVPKFVWYCLGIILGLLSLFVLCRCCAKITEEKIEDSSLISPKGRHYRSSVRTPPLSTHPPPGSGSDSQDRVIFNRTADLYYSEGSSGESSDNFVTKFDSIDSAGREIREGAAIRDENRNKGKTCSKRVGTDPGSAPEGRVTGSDRIKGSGHGMGDHVRVEVKPMVKHMAVGTRQDSVGKVTTSDNPYGRDSPRGSNVSLFNSGSELLPRSREAEGKERKTRSKPFCSINVADGNSDEEGFRAAGES